VSEERFPTAGLLLRIISKAVPKQIGKAFNGSRRNCHTTNEEDKIGFVTHVGRTCRMLKAISSVKNKIEDIT
jgi:hypothetical protein